MVFPSLSRFLPVGLLLFRLMVGIVFLDSGWNDLRSPQERAQSIGKSKNFTISSGVPKFLAMIYWRFRTIMRFCYRT
jgi:uncharacterized membrane protein YphA (DoxX/SURF4 family)